MMAIRPEIRSAVLEAVTAPGSNQSIIARRLGVSITMISQVVSGTYSSTSKKLEEAVRRELINDEVDCPVLGRITYAECDQQQRIDLVGSSPHRVRLYKACRAGCAKFKGQK